MSPLDSSTLRLATDAMTLLASISVGAALLWALFSVRGRMGPRLRPIALMCMFIIALAASNILRYAANAFPTQLALNALAALVAAGALAMAVAVWAFIPKLGRQPTHSELLSDNEALRAERKARIAAAEELQRARDELEQRVAERTEALDLVRRRFEIALQGTGIVVTHQDADLRYTWMYNPPAPLAAETVIGRLPEEVLPLDLARKQASVKQRVIETGEPARFDAIFPTAKGPIWYEGRVEALKVDGKVEGVMTVSIDVTRHMLHERQMREVLRELTHRSKNLLAVVQAMARRSSTGATDVGVFVEAFDLRLQALSRAHELLVDTGWRGVPLRAILEREFAPLRARFPDITIEGPDIQLSPEAAQNFALAINELAGDLRHAASTQQMRVDVSWRTEDGKLLFEWRRNGGDSTPVFDGFGLNLLNRVLPRQIGGEAQLTHAPEACAYRLEGKTALLAPIGRHVLPGAAAMAREAEKS